MKHRWSKPIDHVAAEECIRCGTTRETIATIGIKYHRALRTYVRPDGIRFTGQAPDCDSTTKILGRPILEIFANWRQRLSCAIEENL
jgi:hypothetical protein